MNQSLKLQQLSLASLVDLDGGILAAVVDRALEVIGDDLTDRPGLDKPRELQLSLKVTPQMDARGICESVKATYQVVEKLPPRKSNKLNLGLKPSGAMLFRGVSPDNHAQQGLDFETENQETDDHVD